MKIATNPNSMVLQPDAIKVGMDVALYEGITDDLITVRRATFKVKAIQLPFDCLAGSAFVMVDRHTRNHTG